MHLYTVPFLSFFCVSCVVQYPDQLLSVAASWCQSFFQHSNNWFSAVHSAVLSVCCSTALEKKVSLPTHNQLITSFQLVFLFFYVLKLHQSFRQGCPFRRGCKLLFSCLIYHSFYPEMSLLFWAGLRPVRHRGTSYGTLLSLLDKRQQLSHEGQQSLISKQFPDLWSHTLLIQCRCVVALLSLPLRLCVPCWYPSCSAFLSRPLVLPSVFPSANTICTYDWQRCKYVITSCICSSNSKTSSKIMLPF